jgi:hypothetical protein
MLKQLGQAESHTVPGVMVPFRPIIQEGEKPFAMLKDLWIQNRELAFESLCYSSLDALVGVLDDKIIKPRQGQVRRTPGDESRENERRACLHRIQTSAPAPKSNQSGVRLPPLYLSVRLGEHRPLISVANISPAASIDNPGCDIRSECTSVPLFLASCPFPAESKRTSQSI